MPIEVQGPDGKVHSFPDGTSPEQINSQMSSVYGGRGSLKPQGLPKPGDATSASGAVMPSMQSTPGYRTDEDEENLILGTVFPHMQNVIQNTPGHAMRMEQAKTVGKKLGELEDKQRAGRQILSTLGGLGQSADEGHASGALSGAIGPLANNETFQKAREVVNVGNILGTRDSYNLNNLLHHDIHGLTTAFVNALGSGQMSNARQALFAETMGAMMKATSKEEFDKIKKRAEHIIRDTFNLDPGATPEPSGSGRATTPQTASGPQRQQFRNKQTGAVETFEARNGQWVKVD